MPQSSWIRLFALSIAAARATEQPLLALLISEHCRTVASPSKSVLVSILAQHYASNPPWTGSAAARFIYRHIELHPGRLARALL